ncbi:MAG: phosphoribosyltransferase family protein [Cyclobacteriaceae bacterium]
MEHNIPTSSRIILNAEEIQQKIRRIAYEIFERNFGEERLVLAGIDDRGYLLAEKLATELVQISPFKFETSTLSLLKIQLEKFTQRQCEVRLEDAPENLEGSSVIVVDDVLNTGRTLAYSLRPFLEQPLKKLEIAVLVNRSHIKFPVVASYTGYELATTLEEHIEVVLEENAEAVYLH